ncbi:MAG: NmrA family NAD(P)-binding protein [Gammaproteobacteria bacterium]|nr:NmrA family NAD(P)-binding protein [Gammaproteobacteria bacterium]
MLLITGPNGNIGTELVRKVKQLGDIEYRIAAHTPAKIKHLYGNDTPCVKFDYADRTTWPAALQGVTTLFLLFPLPHPRTAKTWMVPFVEAAAQSGIKHIIYCSVPGAEKYSFIPHNAVENAVRNSGVSYTILQASYFAQNLCRDITTHSYDIATRDEIFLPAKKGLTSFIDSRDMAEVVVSIIKNPAPHVGKTHVLTGPEKLNLYQVANIFTDVTGRKICYSNPSMPRFLWRLWHRGMSWDVLAFMMIVYFLTRHGKNAPMTNTLGELLGRSPTTMREFVRDYAQHWQPRQEVLVPQTENSHARAVG